MLGSTTSAYKNGNRQKWDSRIVLIKRCSINIQQIDTRKNLFPGSYDGTWYISWDPKVRACWTGFLQDMSFRRLQHVFSVTILRLPRRLEDILMTSWKHLAKTSWRHLERRLEDVLKTCIDDVLKTCLEDVLKTYLEDVLKTYLEAVLKILWRQTKYLLGISVFLSGGNKSKCVSNKSIFHKSISDKF